MRLNNFLDESLDSPVKYKLEKDGEDWEAQFSVDADDPDGYYDEHDVSWGAQLWKDKGYWEVAFTTDFLEDIINLKRGASLKILSTVKAIMEEWLKKVKPGWFMFTAKEPSRIKLYKRFAREIGTKAGYHVSTKRGKDGLEFHFKK